MLPRMPARAALLAFALAGCAVTPSTELPAGPGSSCEGKCDGDAASVRTQRDNLLANLLAQMDSPAFLFGQQRFNLTGVNPDGTQWLATEGMLDRSDAKAVTGHDPVVMGFDAWDLAIKPESWAPSSKVHAEAAKVVHATGGIVVLDWHMRGCAADTFNAAGNEACLCKLANDDAFARSWLLDGNYKKLADALERYQLDQIPIVFRPMHEHTGNWFWWGKPFWDCARSVPHPRFTGPAAFQRVFRTIITYLRVERGLENLLVAYAPAGADSLATDDGYLEGYPGDEYVDILGIDLYYQRDPSFPTQTVAFRRQLETVARLARQRGKVAALTEVGNTQLANDTTPAQSRWFSDQLLQLTDGVGLAYALTWENRTKGYEQFWVPYGDHPGVADFRAFEASDRTLFLDDAPELGQPPEHGYPVCGSCTSDPDGDRWGWEHERSCRVASWCLAPSAPICKRCASDPDGDGWGWEDARSCVKLASCT